MRCKLENAVRESRHSCRSREHVLKEVGCILARGLIASMHSVHYNPSIAASESVAKSRELKTAEDVFRGNFNRPLTCEAIARALGVSSSTARNQLKPLLEGGIVKRHGRGPSTTYSHSQQQNT